MSSHAKRIQVPPEAAGGRLDSFLSGHVGSRAKAQRLLADGVVAVDGRAVQKRHILAGGEEIVVTEAERPLDASSGGREAEFTVCFEDEHLLVVDKPAGVVVHPAPGHREGTLSQALATRGAGGGEPWRPGIVHRLDRDTSGLLVVARHEECLRRLRDAMGRRLIQREYLALVEGHLPARTGLIDAPLGRDRRARERMSTDTAKGREARTHFEIVRMLEAATYVRVRLETGRTHQIRAHFQAIGHPLCGDPQYGDAAGFGLRRQFLHAARLAFPHPYGGEPVDVSSPLPSDLEQALERASGVSSAAQG